MKMLAFLKHKTKSTQFISSMQLSSTDLLKLINKTEIKFLKEKCKLFTVKHNFIATYGFKKF